MIALVVVFVIMSFATWKDIRESKGKFENVQKEKVNLLSDSITNGIMVFMLEARWKELQTFIKDMTENSRELKELRIFTPDDGVVVVSSNASEIGHSVHLEIMDKFRLQQKQAPVFSDDEASQTCLACHPLQKPAPFLIKRGDEEYAVRLTPIPNLPICHTCHGSEKKILGVLDAKVSLDAARESLKKFTQDRIINTIISFVFITVIFWIAISILIDRPIKKMFNAIKKVEIGDLSVRIESKQKDELGQLSKGFSEMVESLDSARKEIELCHTHQMMRAAKMASLGELASGIAHEIKNPLTGINSAIQVLISDFPADDPKKKIMEEVLNQVKRLDRTVRDLLAYARPQPPSMAYYNINSILEKTLFFIQQVAKKEKTLIETNFGNNLPDVMIDADQLQQVFMNISINAVQAMSAEGGILKISTVLDDSEKPAEELPDFPGEKVRWLKVIFEDTGPGITPDDIEKIFNPFFTKKGRGTGLGLSISQRIIDEHRGKIIVKSEVGKGSVFTVYMPVLESQGAQKI
jgi:signal transduction histidine kinase